MRILVLTWLWEPQATPRAIRWGALVREFVHSGHQVDVVTSSAPGLPARESRGPLTILRTGGNAFENLRRFSRHSEAKPSAPAAPLPPLRAVASRAFRAGYDATIRKLYWPDKACAWYPAALNCCSRLLSQSRYHLLVTVSLPFTPHLVGYTLHRRFPTLPWLADVGDPFFFQESSGPNNAALFSRLNKYWEGKVLNAAGRIAVTNPALREVYHKAYGVPPSQTLVAPPLLSVFPTLLSVFPTLPSVLPTEASLTSPRAANTEPRRIVFLGTLYRDIRNPAFLLRLFARIRQELPNAFHLHFVGDVGDCRCEFEPWTDSLGTDLVLHGPLPRAAALRQLAEADFVVNIGNTTPYQLPSKLVEYAAFGKPIINIASIENDSSRRFLESYPAVLELRSSPQDLSESDWQRLRRFLTAPPPCTGTEAGAWVAPFRPSAVAALYLDWIPQAEEQAA